MTDTPTPRTDEVAYDTGLRVDSHDKTPDEVVPASFARQLERETVELRQQLAELERGEYICNKCGLRKDSEHEKGDF